MFFFLTISALIAAINAEPILLKPAPRFPAGRIVGGESTEIEKYPYQISLEYFGSHSCGGSIISANYVVTAGHCTTRSPSLMTIRAGSSYKGQGGTVHQVEKIIRHEDYTMNRFGIPLNDVALIRVKEPFIFNATRQPINLFEAGEEAVPGVKSVITGWGNTGKGSPVQLQTVTIPIISKDLCDVAYQSYDGLPNGQICAAYFGVGGKDSCQGDSGGPLTIDGRLAGIVSWGNGCAQPNYPGVYTEVAAFREWIDEHLEV